MRLVVKVKRVPVPGTRPMFACCPTVVAVVKALPVSTELSVNTIGAYRLTDTEAEDAVVGALIVTLSPVPLTPMMVAPTGRPAPPPTPKPSSLPLKLPADAVSVVDAFPQLTPVTVAAELTGWAGNAWL